MKTKITTLILSCVLPIVSFAQPIVETNEYYHIGDLINQVRCNATSVAAGPGGANVNWDFSTLMPSGGIAKTVVAANTSSEFITSNLMITLPDGSKEYMQENNTDSYVDAIADLSGITRRYTFFDLARRPMTYNTNFIDTYRMVITTPSTIGTGIVTQNGDGYGTLKLPTGTYDYVLRIKRTISEMDSVGGSLSGYLNTVTYMWFDTVHSAPLFRIDSASDVTGTAVTAMYLASTTGVKNQNNTATPVKGYLDNNKLILTGNFEDNKEYEVILYNIIGVKQLHEQFVGRSNSQQFDVINQLAPGVYIIDVTEKASPESRSIIKIVKQ